MTNLTAFTTNKVDSHRQWLHS